MNTVKQKLYATLDAAVEGIPDGARIIRWLWRLGLP
jgi:hypothetical protein